MMLRGAFLHYLLQRLIQVYFTYTYNFIYT